MAEHKEQRLGKLSQKNLQMQLLCKIVGIELWKTWDMECAMPRSRGEPKS